MPPNKRSLADNVSRGARSLALASWVWAKGPGRQIATVAAVRVAHQVRLNLTARRLLSFPHLLVLVWLVILLWGERWMFDSKVADCDWKSWEKWPRGATPHHLVLVADPQITDPHTYPGRPWPLSALTAAVTDSYLIRGYKALQGHLHPDSLFFLGDLFDGGREWKPRHGKFVDPKWGLERPSAEKGQLRTWHRKYNEDYWLREYRRFGDIFFDPWNRGGEAPGAWQRGRKLVAGLPGNHDIGFGASVQVSVRDRFNTYFGDGNQVNVVGNHSVVMVDTVSLSASSSTYGEKHDLKALYGPVTEFLDSVQLKKKKLAREEVDFWYGLDSRPKMEHTVEEGDKVDPSPPPPTGEDSLPGNADLPTILLTHVPLYRPPGTPCGPKREHWPPAKPPKGQTAPVVPDHRNAISVMAGYQYQNVLNEADSVRLVGSVGNVVQVFSGDDHDYCEVVHSPEQQSVREITVKSMSMSMGVRNPGFLMVSLYNPIDSKGSTLPGAPAQTLQTHLCILPNQIRTYMRYVTFGLISLGILALRAFLVRVLRLTPFALDPELEQKFLLPVHKEKAEPPETSTPMGFASSASSASTPGGGSRRSLSTTTTTMMTTSTTAATAANGGPGAGNGTARWESKKSRHGKWGWHENQGGPRIRLDTSFYDGPRGWKGSGRGGGRFRLGEIGREMWTTSYRVAWMTVLFWAYLLKTG
ncbi:Cell division control protein 1 [Escovopsis weberi]|uniref:Cell division control protein 1 n=1 Tax=Escovopsis weberi TaxID=150374 RepID=A0A0M8MYI8_ESCWE|nr:Cell division control protein 1 [Escovopsis weberi]